MLAHSRNLVVFLIFHILSVVDSQSCSGANYEVPGYLRCSHVNVAAALYGGSCPDASQNQPDCKKVIDGKAVAGTTSYEWFTTTSPISSYVKIQFARKFAINTVRIMQRANTDEQNKRLRLEFEVGSHKVELTRNTGTSHLAAAEWDTFHFPEVNTTWVKIVVESVYSRFNNGFKEIEFYHNSCNKDKVCDQISIEKDKSSRARPLYSSTAYLLVKSANEVKVELHGILNGAGPAYTFTIGASSNTACTLHKASTQVETKTVSSPLAADKWMIFWIDFRSSNLVFGAGAEVIFQYTDSSPVTVGYISFKASTTSDAHVRLCNREDKCYKTANHYWPMDKVVAGTVFDLNGNMDGTVFNPDFDVQDHNLNKFTAVENMKTISLHLKTTGGSKNYANMGNFDLKCVSDPDRCEPNGITLSLFFFVDSSATGADIVFLSTAESANGRGIVIKYSLSAKKLYVQVWTSTKKFQTEHTLYTGSWQHVALSFKTKLTAAINGKVFVTDSGVASSSAQDRYTSMYLGYFADGTGSALGYVSNLAIWNTDKAFDNIDRILACSYTQKVPRDNSTVGAQCASWVAAGECVKNARYMLLQCRKSCRSDNSDVRSGFAAMKASSSDASKGRAGLWSGYAWTPKPWDTSPYLEIDLFQVRGIGCIETFGKSGEFVKSYSISYSTSCSNWIEYKHNGVVKIFEGNVDGTNSKMNCFDVKTLPARCLRIHPKTWSGACSLKVDVVGTNEAINYIGCFKSGAFVAAGNYDSDSLTPEYCTQRCGQAGNGYSAVKEGNQCFCASALDLSANPKQPDAKCLESCKGNVALRCGGINHYSVYEVKGTYPTPFEIKAPSSISTFTMVNVSLTNYTGATYTIDIGDGTVFSSLQPEARFFFYSPGRVTISAATSHAEYAEPQNLRAESQVEVYSRIVAHHGCPKAVEAHHQAFCTVTACMGSAMELSTQITGHSSVTAYMEDAYSLHIGQLFSPLSEGSSEVVAKRTVLIPNYRFDDDCKLAGWSFDAEKAGYVTLQVWRPVCGRGSDNHHCYSDGTCVTGVTVCNSPYNQTCSGSEIFATESGICAESNVCPGFPLPSLKPEAKYELVKAHHMYISKVGRQFVMFDDFCSTSNIEIVDTLEGDIIGFSYPDANAAKITSEDGELGAENVSALVYEGKTAKPGEIWKTSGVSTAESKNIQYSLQAHCQTLSKFSIPFNYSAIGVYHENIKIKNSAEDKGMAATIVATERISGVNWTTPCASLTNYSADFTVHPHKGYNISYIINYGDNTSESSLKTRTDGDFDFKHIFTKHGTRTVTLCASNELSVLCLDCQVIVQNEVLNLSFYNIVQATALNNVTVTCFYLTAGDYVTLTVAFGDGTAYENGTFDITYIFTACYYHTYSAIGEYLITVNASNLASSLAIDYMAIVEVPLSGCVLTVEHPNRDIEVNETVSIQLTCDQGTNPLYVCDLDDGNVVTTTSPPIPKSYAVWRFYNINCTINNNVSRVNVSQTIQVHKPVDDLTGFCVTTTPTNLTDPVAFVLNITTGTDFNCTWTWQDGTTSETSWEDLGDLVYHQYASVGAYSVIVNCTNRLYNTTVGVEAIVQKPITSFVLTDPGSRPHDKAFTARWSAATGTNITYNVTWTHILSGVIRVIPVTTISQDTLSANSLIDPASFPIIGVYELSVTAVNLVTNLQYTSVTVYVDKVILSPVLTNCHDHYVANGTTCFTLTLTQGSNVTLDWTFSDNRPSNVRHEGDFPPAGSEIQHEFWDEGTYAVTVFCHNSVSNFSLTNYILIQHPNEYLILTSDTPQPIPDGVITFTVSLLPGTEPPSNTTFNCTWGDDTELQLQKILTLPLNLTHKYPLHGEYLMHCSFANLISNITLSSTIEVQEPIKNFESFTRHSAGDAGAGAEGRGPDKNFFPQDYPVVFNSTITNGTNVSYYWDFGDGNNMLTMNHTVDHKYNAAGNYKYYVIAENAVSKARKEGTVNLQKIVTGVSCTNDGPIKKGLPITFSTSLGQEATNACYLFDLDNGTKIVYKDHESTVCEPDCSLPTNKKSFSGLQITFKHNYTFIRNYKVKLTACNKVSKIEVNEEAAILALPCRYPEVNITESHAAKNLTSAPKYKKSESFKVSSSNKIDCEASHETSKLWEIYKISETDVNDTKITPPKNLFVKDATLVVSPRTLDYGCYRVVLTLTMLSVDGVFNSATAFLCIIPSPLLPGIAGGSALAIGFGKNYTVDASPSYDPDVDPDNRDGITFEWFCAKSDENFLTTSNTSNLPIVSIVPPFQKQISATNSTNSTNSTVTDAPACGNTSGCFPWVNGPAKLNVSSSRITFFTGHFTVNCDYEIFAKMRKDTRSGPAKLTLFVKEGDPPVVEMGYKLGFEGKTKINPKQKLSVYAAAVCSSCPTGTRFLHEWSLSKRLDDGTTKKIENAHLMVSTPLNKQYLVVKENTLNDLDNCVIRVEVWARGTTRGFAEVSRKINKSPSGGVCSITPSTGEAVFTEFVITCRDWVDDDKPITYNVYHKDGPDSLKAGPVSSEKETFTLKLPLGKEEFDYKIFLTVEVTDKEGAVTEVELTVQSKKKELSKEEQSDLFAKMASPEGDLANMASSGNSQGMLSAIGNLASLLPPPPEPAATKDSTSSVAPAKSEPTEAEKELVSAMTKLATSVPVTSDEGLKQKASVMSSLASNSGSMSTEAKAQVGEAYAEMGNFAKTMEPAALKDASKAIASGIGNMFTSFAPAEPDPVAAPAASTSGSSSSSGTSEADAKAAAEEQKRKEAKLAKKMLAAMDTLKDALSSKQTPGEEAAVIDTPNLKIAVKADSPEDLAEASAPGSNFGGLKGTLADNTTDPVSTQVMAIKVNPHSSADGAADVVGGITSLDMGFLGGGKMNVSGLENPIEMMISRDGGPVNSTHNCVGHQEMVFHSITVNKNHSSIQVILHPTVNFTGKQEGYLVQLFVYLKRGSRPSREDYDFNISLPDLPPANPTSDNTTQKNLKDPYLMLISNEAMNRTAAGMWYVGVYYNTIISPVQGEGSDSGEQENAGGSGSEEEEVVAPPKACYDAFIFTSACVYFDEVNEKFSTGGMTVGPLTNASITHCFTSHLTSFASDFFVPPNKIDWSKISLSELLNNPIVMIIVCSIFALYFLLVIWSRWADKRDLQKIGVTPLPDNDPRDTYLYEIVVYTGFNSQAGTSSEVTMILTGGLDETSPRILKDADPSRRKFCRGNVDYFLVAVPSSLGKLKELRIWHNNSGDHSSWYLLRCMVHDLQTDSKTWFICDRWLAVEEDDGSVERALTPATKEELTSFNLLFSTEARKNLADGHLWFSVVIRPAKSTFTRVQRLSCCLSILLCTMLANAMFYQVDDKSSSGTSIHLGPFSFSIKQLSIGLTSSMVVLPVNILIVTIFRKARPPEPKKERLSKDQDPHNQSSKYEAELEPEPEPESEPEPEPEPEPETDEEELTKEEKKARKKRKKAEKKKNKKKFSLPHYFVYVAYGLVFLASTVSATFTVFYGLTFGKEKSEAWISTMMISFWQDVLVSQPLKVFAAATFFALVIKDPNKAEDDPEQNNELSKDEELLHKKAKNTDEEKALRKIGFVDKPPDPAKLEASRQLRLKQKMMKAIIYDVIRYFIFVCVTIVVAYGSRDPMAYGVTRAMEEFFVKSSYSGMDAFDNVGDPSSYYAWLQQSFIPSVIPKYWYGPVTKFNQSGLLDIEIRKNRRIFRIRKTSGKKSFVATGSYVEPTSTMFEYNNGYVADHETSWLVGSPRIRQLRIRKGKCTILPTFVNWFPECNARYDTDKEDMELYETGWAPMNNSRKDVLTEQEKKSPWTYQGAWKLKGAPFWGMFASYWGGGYVADLGNNREGAEEYITRLQKDHWIDRYTRALFAEFTIYNPYTNFFCAVTLLAEILPTGGYYHYPKVQTLRIYRYVGPEMVVVMGCEFIFVAFLLYFIYKELKQYMREKKEYFKDFWNLVEFLVIALSASAMGLFFARLAVTGYSIKNMHQAKGEYVSFQYVAMMDEWVTGCVGLAVFFSILKLLRMLRFNRRMSMLSATIKAAAKPLVGFFIYFAVVFLAFAQFAFVVMGGSNENYATFHKTIATQFSLTLGSFDFEAINLSNRMLGPLYFFFYVLCVLFILMNVFLSIINDTFVEVSEDVSLQGNEHEIMDFMFHTIKKNVGKQVGPAIKPIYKESKTKLELELDSIDEISENVEYALRNICMEDIRQTNWFETKSASSKKKMLIRLLLETDEEFTENDICDAIPLFDKLLKEYSEQDLMKALVAYKAKKKLEDLRALQEKDDDVDSSDDDDDDDDDDDGDSDSDSEGDDSDAQSATVPKTTEEEEKMMEDILGSRRQSRVQETVVRFDDEQV